MVKSGGEKPSKPTQNHLDSWVAQLGHVQVGMERVLTVSQGNLSQMHWALPVLTSIGVKFVLSSATCRVLPARLFFL